MSPCSFVNVDCTIPIASNRRHGHADAAEPAEQGSAQSGHEEPEGEHGGTELQHGCCQDRHESADDGCHHETERGRPVRRMAEQDDAFLVRRRPGE